MKHYIPYIIAAVVGLFSSAVYCLLSGVFYYEFGWIDVFMAFFFVVITWCWRGEDGIGADILRILRSFHRGGGHED